MKRIILLICLCIAFGSFSGCRNTGDAENDKNILENNVAGNDVYENIPDDSAGDGKSDGEENSNPENADEPEENTVIFPDEIINIIGALDTSEAVINLGASLFREYIVTPLCLDIIFTPFESFSELPTEIKSAYIKGKFADLSELDTYFPDEGECTADVSVFEALIEKYLGKDAIASSELDFISDGKVNILFCEVHGLGGDFDPYTVLGGTVEDGILSVYLDFVSPTTGKHNVMKYIFRQIDDSYIWISAQIAYSE